MTAFQQEWLEQYKPRRKVFTDVIARLLQIYEGQVCLSFCNKEQNDGQKSAPSPQKGGVMQL